MAGSRVGLGREAKWVGTSDLDHAEVHVVVDRSLPNWLKLKFGGRNARLNATVKSSTAKGRNKGDAAFVSRDGDVSLY